MVSRLRQRIGPDQLPRRLDGYALAVDAECIDSVRFERLVASARATPDPAMALRLVDDALAMWVGTPFGPLSSERAFTARVARLLQLRNEALALRIEALVTLRRIPEAALTAAKLIEHEPTNERAHVLAMFATQQSGDIADELIGFTRLRMLVTSRRVLGSHNEAVHQVTPLPWHTDAVELFRLRSPRSFRSATEQEAAQAICRRLDGLPLAIEIAAARTRARAPSELLQRLDRIMPSATNRAATRDM